MKSHIYLLCAILSIFVFTAPLTAQSSYTNSSTATVIETDTDFYMDVNDFKKVEMENFFSFIRFADSLTAGFAKNFGNNYIGLYYSGNLLSGNSAKTTVETAGTSVRQDPADTGILWGNYIAALWGNDIFGAFRLDIGLTGLGTDTDETGVNVTDTTTGDIRIGLTWGKNFGLGGGLLKPEAGVEYYLAMNKVKYSATNSDDYILTNGNLSTLSFRLGTDFELERKGKGQSILSFYYLPAFVIYPSSNGEMVIGNTTVSGEIDSSNMINGLSFRYRYIYEMNERFSSGIAANLYVTLTSAKETPTTVTEMPGSTTSVKGDTQTYFSAYVAPSIGAGFSFKVKPEVFTLNGGLSLTLPYYTYTNTKDDGTPETESKSHSWTRLTPSARIGGTLNITPAFSLDMQLSSSFGNTPATATTYDFLSTTFSIMATIKK
ncbi:hypothetical protein K7I13_15055 [Brucepastera parasyntrophica]|uniref:TDE2508 family outer membrane beta-barrel protein n=1 Tax=Brucepastera parasyntrophica TaxID=2880008 RepID=UPI00210A4555|nr:hypothetical protein [Brucepastera parasyntrophica]ULQ59748.1 hypothetical protein K7I13_15055 [Brucepastera parasyntrophica]